MNLILLRTRIQKRHKTYYEFNSCVTNAAFPLFPTQRDLTAQFEGSRFQGRAGTITGIINITIPTVVG